VKPLANKFNLDLKYDEKLNDITLDLGWIGKVEREKGIKTEQYVDLMFLPIFQVAVIIREDIYDGRS